MDFFSEHSLALIDAKVLELVGSGFCVNRIMVEKALGFFLPSAFLLRENI